MDADTQTTNARDNQPSSVQMCSFCQKPFLNELSHKRHVQYCRHAKDRPRARTKSCRPCTKGKRKCSGEAQCSRCTRRGVQCVYDTPINPSGAGPVAPATTTASTVAEQDSMSLHTSINTARTLDDLDSSLTDAVQMNGGEDIIDWNCFNTAKSDLDITNSTLDLPSSLLGSGLILDDTIDDTSIRQGEVNGNEPFPSRFDMEGEGNSLIIATQTMERSVAILTPIPMLNPNVKATANVVLQMLYSFPQMMVRRQTFPPFIHGHWFHSSDTCASSLPKPLMNCMGLAQIFASQNLETRPFLWQKIREEQRTLADQGRRLQLSEGDHLAAIQALLIYIIMRVIDNSELERDLNLEILRSYQGLCDDFKVLRGEPFYQHELFRHTPNWQAWVFAESRRRTAIVWLLITQMVQIKIGVPCDSFDSVRDVPLSCPRMLWEARTLADWEAEYELYKTSPRLGLDHFGDLYDACKQSSTPLNKRKLRAWNASKDNLGMLLSLGVEMM